MNNADLYFQSSIRGFDMTILINDNGEPTFQLFKESAPDVMVLESKDRQTISDYTKANKVR